MTKVVQMVRHDTAGANLYTGPVGQITYVTDTGEIRTHDGVVPGGDRILTLAQLETVFQTIDADLTAIAALDATAGLLAKTGSAAYARRTLTAPAAGISVSNGTGAAGNPTLALANDLAALEGLASTGIAVRDNTDSWVQRTLTGTAAEITVTNGNGVSGNPTISLPSALTFTGKTITGGTINGATLGADTAFTTAASTRTALGVAYASNAEVVTGTETGKVVSPSTLHRNQGVAKAGITFIGTTTGTHSGSAKFNCDSVTRNGAGDYTITFTNDFADTNYIMSWALNAAGFCYVSSKSVGSITVVTRNSADSLNTEPTVDLLFFGTLA
jgi:hypothetical protein